MNAPELLLAVVQELSDFADRLVFTGGLALPLYLERKPQYRNRLTYDTDVVVACSSHRAWLAVQTDLAQAGVVPLAGVPGAPICRMRTPQGHIVDVMPDDPTVLGFGNRWYQLGVAQAIPYPLEPGRTIHIFSAPLYLATKWEAYRGRGQDDPWMSHDLEDILTLLAYRPSLKNEVRTEPQDVKDYLTQAARDLLALEDIEEIVLANIGDCSETIFNLLDTFQMP